MAKLTRHNKKVPSNGVGRGSPTSASSKAILAAVPDMMFRIDRDGRYLEYKPAKGLEPYVAPEALLGHTMQEVLPKDVADEGLRLIRAALDTGEDQLYEYQLLEDAGLTNYEARMVSLGQDDALVIVRLISRASDREAKSGQHEEYALTKRELSVLQAVASGLTDKAVAQQLSISPLTVRKHVASIRKKMGAQSRTEASVRALKAGLVT